MPGFKSAGHAQRFLVIFGLVADLFRCRPSLAFGAELSGGVKSSVHWMAKHRRCTWLKRASLDLARSDAANLTVPVSARSDTPGIFIDYNCE